MRSPLSFYDSRVVDMREKIALAIAEVADELSGPMYLHSLILVDVAGWFEEVPTNSHINDRISWQVEFATKKVLGEEVRLVLEQKLVEAIIDCLDETTWNYVQPFEMAIDDL